MRKTDKSHHESRLLCANGLGGAVAYYFSLPGQWIVFFFFTKLQPFKILYRIPGSRQLNKSDTLSPLSPILLGSKIKGNLILFQTKYGQSEADMNQPL